MLNRSDLNGTKIRSAWDKEHPDFMHLAGSPLTSILSPQGRGSAGGDRLQYAIPSPLGGEGQGEGGRKQALYIPARGLPIPLCGHPLSYGTGVNRQRLSGGSI